MTTTTTEKRTPAYTVRKNAEGLTGREQEFRELYALGTLTQTEIAERMGVNKQRVSEWKKKLEADGKLELPKPLEEFSKSEWRALSAGLRKFAADATTTPTAREAAGRAIEKGRQLLPKGVRW